VKILLVTLLLFSRNLFDLSDMLFSTLQVHMNLMQTSHEFFMQFFMNLMQIYEPVTEGCYIKMIDMVSDQGGQMQVNNISGYLPGRIVFFLVNTHITPRPILLTRHGESQDNVRGRIGGDPPLRYYYYS
jgi:hypothetical protein